MAVPSWQAATAGFSALAGHVNQFLCSHAVTYLYTGAQQANQQTSGGGGTTSNGLWIAQSFATSGSQATVGYIMFFGGRNGSPSPWQFSLQASSAGAPSGTPLVSASLPAEFAGAGGAWITVPLPASGLSVSTTYWIVAQANGNVSVDWFWNRSNQASGASTSANGTTWTAQAYGLLFRVFDQQAVLPLAGTWEDSGARWTALAYNGSGQLTGIEEYTAGQAANGYTASSRALSYTSGLLTGVA